MLASTHRIAKIKDYGVIGDCRSTALVSKYGSIDWLCWPRFDSASIFAALLDSNHGGFWSISPRQPYTVGRRYIHNTNVLETEFKCAAGRATLLDLMPVCSEEFKREALVPDHEILRRVVCDEGQVEIAVEFYPRVNYGLRPVRVRSLGALGIRMDVGRGAYWLRCNVPLQTGTDSATLTTVLKRGEELQFSLTYTEQSPAVLPALGEMTRPCVERSIRWWQKWADQCSYDGPYRDEVLRSALALKLLAYAPSGAIIAAATTSLPELLGGDLNWDYRYCWLRDASLTMRAMLGLGYVAEAESFLNWMLLATRLTQPKLRVLYNLYGEMAAKEKELNRLGGYFNSKPVRIGNGARKQCQLDIYGEVIDAAAQFALVSGLFDRTTQKALIGFGNYVAKNWDQPDEGIWEPRSGRENHTHSRLMCWTALDRLLALAEKRVLQNVPQERYVRERDRIAKQIRDRAWNSKLQSYVSVLDGDDLDASLLRMSWYGFEEADCERQKSTYSQIRRQLGAGNGLLYRYRRERREGAFGICGFWGVEQLAIGGGTLDEAHDDFQRLLRYQNDLGLFAEEIDPETGEALGNFPQAFTHVGLISAALTLKEREQGTPRPAVQTGSDVDASANKVAQ